MSEYVMDAHALIWHLENNPKLGRRAREILNDPHSLLFLPSIALAEACRVVAKGRTVIADWQAMIQAVRQDPRVTVVPLDLEIVEISMGLPGEFELHDGQIVATVVKLQRTLATKVDLLTIDRNITDSGLVAVLW